MESNQKKNHKTFYVFLLFGVISCVFCFILSTSQACLAVMAVFFYLFFFNHGCDLSLTILTNLKTFFWEVLLDINRWSEARRPCRLFPACVF